MAGLSTPTAILIGSVIFGAFVSAGLFLGLRGRSAPVASPAGASPSSSPASAERDRGAGAREMAPSDSAVPAAAPTAAPAPSADTNRARQEAIARFDQARADLVKRCWVPLASGPGPAHSQFRMHVALDANGMQLGRSFLDGADARPGVAQCVNLHMPPVSVSPTGARVTLEVPLSFP